MSAQTTENKFPGQHAPESKGPGPSQLNPSGAFPQSDPQAHPNPPKEQGSSIGQAMENPYALEGPINKLESALDELIAVFEKEGETTGQEGNFTKGKEGIELFKSWKTQLDQIKMGKK